MKTTAKCTCCNATYSTAEMIATAMPNRGNRNAYMCPMCATRNRYYHAQNNAIQGVQKANGVGLGIELETSYTDEQARNELFEYGFIPTHDCSLSSDGQGAAYGWDDRNACEYVSGIMQGLNIASKLAVSVEKLIKNGHMSINDSCGTHTHISVNTMKNANSEQIYMGYIGRFYQSLFTPLSDTIAADYEKAVKIFGRFFNDYCERITTDSSAGNRYNFINVTNSSNIEFRLNKFQNAAQFQNLLKMEVEMVKAIVTNFCEHFDDEKIDSRRYSMTEYRKHKADVTAAKLVKIYEKYAAKI